MRNAIIALHLIETLGIPGTGTIFSIWYGTAFRIYEKDNQNINNSINSVQFERFASDLK